MIKDAEKFADEDKRIKEKVEAKNELESYAYSLKNQIGDKEKLGAKLTDDDKTKIEESLDAAIKWLDANGESADTSELKAKKKELEDSVQPIIAKLYASGAGPTPGGGPEADSKDEL